MHKRSITIPALKLQQHKVATYAFGMNITTPDNISEEDIRSLAKQFLIYKVGKHNILQIKLEFDWWPGNGWRETYVFPLISASGPVIKLEVNYFKSFPTAGIQVVSQKSTLSYLELEN